MCSVYVNYIFINTHTHACIYFRKIKCFYITFKCNINYKNIKMYMEIFSMYVCLSIHIKNIHSTHKDRISGNWGGM